MIFGVFSLKHRVFMWCCEVLFCAISVLFFAIFLLAVLQRKRSLHGANPPQEQRQGYL